MALTWKDILYKNVSLYLYNNNYVYSAPAADLVEHWYSDLSRGTSGAEEPWRRHVHALGVGVSPLRKPGTGVDPDARGHVGTSSLICTWSQT